MADQDRVLRRRWEQRRERIEQSPPWRSGFGGRIGRVRIYLPDSPEWYANRFILVKDNRTQHTLLTIRQDEWQWELWSGIAPEPVEVDYGPYREDHSADERLLATWSSSEFYDLFCGSGVERDRALTCCLDLIKCPTCTSWTGGGICFQCAKVGAKELFEGLSDDVLRP